MRLETNTGEPGGAPLQGSLGLVRARLRSQRALDAAAIGGWAGAAVGAFWAVGWLLRLLPLPHPSLLLLPMAVGAAIAASFAARRFQPTETELALIVDRLLGSREAVVTSLEARGRLAARVNRAAEQALEDAGPTLKAGLPYRLRRALMALPLAVLALFLLTLIPQIPPRATPAGPAGDPNAEAERLDQRKDALERELGVELPEELDAEFAELVEAMKRGGDQDTLAEQAEALADKLDKHRQQLESGGAAQQLKEAADALAEADGDAAQDLEDAAKNGDLDAAKDAIERMRERMDNKPQKERDEAARQLEKAAEAAQSGGMPGLSDALKQEAARARDSKRGGGQSGSQGEGAGQQGKGGQEGGGAESGQAAGQQGKGEGGEQGQQGQQGGQQGQGQQGAQGGGAGESGGQPNGQGGQQAGDQPGGQGGLGEYLEQLGEQGLGGDGLAEQQKQMDLSQGLGNALGGAAGRVGEGRSGEGGGDQEGTGWGAGSSHTDEDQGNHDGAANFQDRDRQVDGRTSNWTTEYGQEHDEKRLQGVKALATSVDVPLGDGPVDVETLRLRGSDERATSPLLQAPPGYREAAEEAIQG